jgi:competence protein ComEA
MKRYVAITVAVAFLLALAASGSVALAQKKKSSSAGQKAATPQAEKKTTEATPKSDLLDVNTATEEQLKTLPGIGNAYAKAVVDHRPYKAKSDLVTKKVIPKAAYKKISSMIIAKQSK